MIKTRTILILILLVAALLRVWSLSSTPPSPDWDEAAYGYNAYSILKTGNDEYGVKLPPILKSFGDYKPALYAYLTVPSVAVFGLNTFAVRLPNAIFGIIGVLGLFYLVKTIFKRDDIALISAFFLAIAPWSIQFSRFSHEGIVAVTLNILTALFFLKGLKNYKLLLASAFFCAVSVYSYQSEKLFAPLLASLLFAVFYKDVLRVPRKYIAISLIVGIIVLLPMLAFVVKDKSALGRAQGTSVFAHQTEVLNQSARQLIKDRENNDVVGLVVHNRRFIYAEKIIQNYVSHFDPRWLFIKGDLPRHHPPNMGIMYLFYLPLLILGLLMLVRGLSISISRRYKLLILGWLFLSIIPSSFTFDVPHAGRSMNAMPIPEIIAGLGLLGLILFVKGRVRPLYFKGFLLGIALVFLLSFSYYLNQYFVKLNKVYSSEWQYGYEQAVSEVARVKDSYQTIVISDRVPMDQSYIFFLFYLKYPPEDYQSKHGVNHSFDKFEFREIDWDQDSKLEDALIVGSSKDIPANAPKLKTIKNLSGDPAILLSSTK